MEKFIKILLLLSLSSCYTKKHAIEKFCHQDTLTYVVHDTIVRDSVHADTTFLISVDTITLTKQNLTIRYIKVKDKIYLSGDVKSDTVYYTKTITIPFTNPKVTTWQHIKAVYMWFWIPLVLGILIGFEIAIRLLRR